MAAGDIFYGASGWDRRPLGLLRIPRTVQDAVGRRVALLGAPAGQVIALAAVAGRRFDIPLLQELTGLDERDLVEAIKELRAAQLVVEETADRFAFRHALTRQAIYAGLLARERRVLHRAIAAILERDHATEPGPYLGDLAYHYAEAQEWEKALEYARRAGERARRLYAPRAAIEQFGCALAAASRLAYVAPPSLHLARGEAYELVGDFEAARADFEAALRRRARWRIDTPSGRRW
jgi:predicted ATPase